MILDDDSWIPDLLEQIIHSPRRHTQISCIGWVEAAMAEWQRSAAELVIWG